MGLRLKTGAVQVTCLILIAWLLAGIASWAEDLDEHPYSRRSVPAHRLSQPPTVDGDLSDPVWHEAAVGDTFIDNVTSESASDQTRFWLGYDSDAIYLAVYCCWDSDPSRLVMYETKRDAVIRNDDHIGFDLDLFHTHNAGELSVFRVTPRGTQQIEIRSGRSGKTEWQGDWEAAAKVVDDG